MQITQNNQPIILESTEGTVLSFFGETLIRKAGSEHTKDRWAMYEDIAPSESGPPPHRHPWDEAYYVLEGELAVQVENQTVKATPGCFLYIPADTVHCFRVVSPTSARFLVWFSPAAIAEKFYQQLADEAGEMPPNSPFAYFKLR